MKRNILFLLAAGILFLAACADKKKQGTIVYQLEYQLPDSLRGYAPFLPKQATVHFKDDSVMSVQGMPEESTTIITHQPSQYMLVLLKSATKSFQVNFNKSEQAQELPDMTAYSFAKDSTTKIIAGYNAQLYLMKNKVTGETSQAWFTHDLTIPPSALTMFFDQSMGVPLVFSTNQNGFITKTTVKQIRFEPIAEGTFGAPAGYQKLTPQQLKEMPVGN
jgi:hypothetical protein